MDTVALQKLALTLSFIACPNCGGRLYPKPELGSLTNIRCNDCFFEARFITLKGRHARGVFNISTADRERILKEKIILPPFIMHWSWYEEKTKTPWEVAVFYPFIPHTFLNNADVPVSLINQSDDTLIFIKDEDLLNTVIYRSPSDEELAEVVSNWEVRSTAHLQHAFSFGYAHSALIIELANNIRRKKGLPIKENNIDEEDDDE